MSNLVLIVSMLSLVDASSTPKEANCAVVRSPSEQNLIQSITL